MPLDYKETKKARAKFQKKKAENELSEEKNLISLTTAQLKWTILKWAKYLRETEHWTNIFISPDLTNRGREAGKKLGAELKRRRNEGEQNLAIRRNQIITLKKTESEPPILVDN
ncbi:hypothetical protein LSH36_240g04008 [Paralvinella palmiformis]|uniref:Uncharacterized protein n=1 Tax=Paralvinella palmiformis TaxID=53620 RepID=A0AAD9N364_9ANNE|nr:hypothetical protein LSH36_240g04008 [Paralvinella palmiformis]